MIYLTAIKPLEGYKKTTWLYKCVCGAEKPYRPSDVKPGRVVSCGCKKGELGAHSNTRRATSLQNYRLRWQELEKLNSPTLQLYLSELAKEYPVYV